MRHPANRHRHFNSHRFQSTHPMRGETTDDTDRTRVHAISIHSPCEGRDALFKERWASRRYFNPLALYGARRTEKVQKDHFRHFNPLTPRGARQQNVICFRLSPFFISNATTFSKATIFLDFKCFLPYCPCTNVKCYLIYPLLFSISFILWIGIIISIFPFHLSFA